jgi:CubicO group peptidase (beta-lactamase class C family)
VRLVLLVLVALAPGVARAQDNFSDRVDAYVASEMAREHVPGVSIAVVKAGQIVLAKGYGLANVEHQVPVKTATVFQSGSVGKQFTAAAVMMLVEQGRLSLDDRIATHFPEAPPQFPSPSRPDRSGRTATSDT